MTTLFRRFSICSCVIGTVVSAAMADPVTLKQARSFIGDEAALEAVTSLRFEGQLEVMDLGDDAPDGPVTIKIFFQKPDRQRITATNGTRVETTALDGYDAWQRVSDSADPSVWRVTLLGPEQIKRLRANTFENLTFYRGLEDRGGRVEDLGPAKIDGVDCHKIAFVHGPGIVFTRWFELTSGRLMLTRTESGTDIREEGEIRTGGLRFPKKIITHNSLPDGGKRVIQVTFDQIEVNPTIDPDLFCVPPMADQGSATK